ncbi:enoyl-CoA hydratase-related protein [Aquincola sp. MAHUQ-54]|uniref:Enoyl-CoA hydratase-related protein n=1 Tax=Aquincola agrisoli TaxID=3119538 RepID=A0AAW9Q8Q8_9BURK
MPFELLTERRDATLVLTLSDPATRNTLSRQACAAGIEVLNNAADDPTLRCLVLHGGGAHFCAGLESPAVQAGGPDEEQDLFRSLLDALRACPLPVIAAMEGTAADAGLVLALACDLVVAAEDAQCLWSRAPRAPSLARLLPRALAMQMLWLAEPLAGTRLHALGLANAAVPAGQALPEALRWSARLAAAPAATIAEAKEWLQRS